ncbi:hypothetical protein [Corynebacterium freneyi]|uniref:Uncharacterized protein n=1 Tax=Corynebacterium freneyi DNF00450 TaxID=1287475 RepID=A0A095ZFH1_9CORY|nr:hypothetical protein [Corynebacterium freneyi]KGF17387.1 hypothetical protein HMPREF1650_04305 [Corynebacterium freneyi DNF00450]
MRIILTHDPDTNQITVELDLAGARPPKALSLILVGALAVIHEVADNEEHEVIMATELARSILTRSVTGADDGVDPADD